MQKGIEGKSVDEALDRAFEANPNTTHLWDYGQVTWILYASGFSGVKWDN